MNVALSNSLNCGASARRGVQFGANGPTGLRPALISALGHAWKLKFSIYVHLLSINQKYSYIVMLE